MREGQPAGTPTHPLRRPGAICGFPGSPALRQAHAATGGSPSRALFCRLSLISCDADQELRGEDQRQKDETCPADTHPEHDPADVPLNPPSEAEGGAQDGKSHRYDQAPEHSTASRRPLRLYVSKVATSVPVGSARRSPQACGTSAARSTCSGDTDRAQCCGWVVSVFFFSALPGSGLERRVSVMVTAAAPMSVAAVT